MAKIISWETLLLHYRKYDKNDNSLKINDYSVPNFTNKKLDKVKSTLDGSSIKYVVLGIGDKVVKQSPSNGDVITTNDTIYLITNDTNITVPNVVGLSSKVAKSVLQNLGIKVNLDGVGYVTSQSVSEGTNITNGMEIMLTLNPKYSLEDANG